LVSVLMSPHFCYRADLIDDPSFHSSANFSRVPTEQRARSDAPYLAIRNSQPPVRNGMRPLSDYALASRLSYFLWASLPDQELLARAAAGDLRQPAILVAQARRMLKDPRA